MVKNFSRDFYDIQRQQWRKSLFLFSILIVFYFFAIGLVLAVLWISFGFFLARETFLSQNLLMKLLVINSAVAIIIASFHFFDARKFGAKFIKKRLRVRPPDLSDRYHKQFANTVDEIRIASGLPKVTPYIIPEFAINSMALIEADNTPSVIVTEGLLAECTRDELQAVIAHELAHIIRGDTFYITLVCSLTNFFERLRQALEPDRHLQGRIHQTVGRGAGIPLVYLAVTLSSIIMHLISTLISREREILADAAAVELCRNPRALARSIYKAHLKNSFVGDFNLTYSPLFIVPPESKGNNNGFFNRLFNSHPPLMKRIILLAEMIKIKPAKIIEEVWEIQRNREKARRILLSREEVRQGRPLPTQKAEELSRQEVKVWSVRDPKGNWRGPFSIEELLFLRFFTPMIWIKNLQEGVEAHAREFPQIRNALRNLWRKKPISASKKNRCPRCHIPLSDSFYEGVAIKVCQRCRGKLVNSGVMERIIARREVAFSEHLEKKAKEFKERFMLNPIRTRKINPEKSPNTFCPNCGAKMLPRPYTYQYVIPVDKCFCCYQIWFDADELEILQILTEKR